MKPVPRGLAIVILMVAVICIAGCFEPVLPDDDNGQNVITKVTSLTPVTPSGRPSYTVTITPRPLSGQAFDGSWTMGGTDGVPGFGNCMVLYQAGSEVMGNFPEKNGRVTGTITQTTLSGVWSKPPTYTGDTDSGKFSATLSDDGKYFFGLWGYGLSSLDRPFTGTRTSAGCAATPVTVSPKISPVTSVTSLTPQVPNTMDGVKSAAVRALSSGDWATFYSTLSAKDKFRYGPNQLLSTDEEKQLADVIQRAVVTQTEENFAWYETTVNGHKYTFLMTKEAGEWKIEGL